VEQVVAKRQAIVVVDHDAGPDGLVHDLEHDIDGFAADGGERVGREVASQDRGPAKQREPGFAEEP
jgi:hypothetical protein